MRDEYIVNQFPSRKSSQPLNPYCQETKMLTLVRKSIDIKTPVDSVFTYFARPEHVSDQIKNDSVGMTVIPMDIKEGMGVGTTFRIIGDFSGKRLEWIVKQQNLSEMKKLLLNKLKVLSKTGQSQMSSNH